MTRAIEHANHILDWRENLTGEDMPPKWMWHLDHELVEWFEMVEERRKQRYNVGNADTDTSDGNSFMKNEWSVGDRE